MTQPTGTETADERQPFREVALVLDEAGAILYAEEGTAGAVDDSDGHYTAQEDPRALYLVHTHCGGCTPSKDDLQTAILAEMGGRTYLWIIVDAMAEGEDGIGIYVLIGEPGEQRLDPVRPPWDLVEIFYQKLLIARRASWGLTPQLFTRNEGDNNGTTSTSDSGV